MIGDMIAKIRKEKDYLSLIYLSKLILIILIDESCIDFIDLFIRDPENVDVNNPAFLISILQNNSPAHLLQICFPLQNNGGYLEEGFDGIVGTFDIPRKVVPCWSLFKAVYVDILGNIRPCCYSHKMKCGVIDNNTIRFTTEEKDDYVVESNMKKLHLEGKIPDECSKCLRYQF